MIHDSSFMASCTTYFIQQGFVNLLILIVIILEQHP